MRSLERRLERLETLDRHRQLADLKDRYCAVVEKLSDREFAFALVADLKLSKGIDIGDLSEADRQALTAYEESGALKARNDYLQIAGEEPEFEMVCLVEDLIDSSIDCRSSPAFIRAYREAGGPRLVGPQRREDRL